MEHWITVDLHLGHTNIITYSGRPFRHADEMNECIVERWIRRSGGLDSYVRGCSRRQYQERQKREAIGR